MRTYSELITLPTFRERFEYLKLDSEIGKETFGVDRYLNQRFYSSAQWKQLRHKIITRDLGCDLGLEGYEIYDAVYIHHMNPISSTDILEYTEYLTNPEFLICTTFDTHNAIHYGVKSLLPGYCIEERQPFDTSPWRH